MKKQGWLALRVALLALLLLVLLAPLRRSAGLEALREGEARLAAGEFTAAEQALQEAARLLPRSPAPALRLTHLYQAWGRPEAGLIALEEAVRRGTAGEEVVSLRLDLLAESGAWDRLREAAAARLAEEPRERQALELLTRALLHQHACAAAEARAATWYAVAPGESAAQRIWGALVLNSEVICRAGGAPCTALQQCPAGESCALPLGQALLAEGEWALAACVLEQAVEATPGSASAHAWLGAALERLGELGAARSHLEQAVELAPEEPLGRLLLGQHLLQRGEVEKAREALFAAHRLDPQNPAPVLAMAGVFAAQGSYSEADVWAEAALERAADDPEMWKAVARFYLQRNLSRGGRVQEITAGAVERAPEDAEAWLLLGWARLLEGDGAGALQALDEALSRSPALAQAHYLRAQALHNLGRSEEAQQAFLRAADLGHR